MSLRPEPAARAAAALARPRLAPSYLNVNEHFGPTIQGEGRHAGALCSFLRLSGCNLTCSWCDTPYTWDWDRFDKAAETHRMPVEEVASLLADYPGRLVVSGGEPLVQARSLALLLAALPGRLLDVETNGTRPLAGTAGFWSTVTCSPKITPSAEQGEAAHEIHPEVEEVADFKFVIKDKEDLGAVLWWLNDHRAIAHSRVWLMPEGVTTDALTERTPFVMDAATKYGFNFTSRLHVYGWAEARGH